ncbi:MAG: regulatory protein RecX [Clostridia bacterium]|nr:regulatory protein RecX [Clostridia bacterium]
MKITAKNGKNLKIHVSIDGEYLITVDRDFWYSCGLVSGDEIDDKELSAFFEAASSRRAFNAAMNYLDYREHSEKELRAKLARGFEDTYVDSAIERLKELGLLNDGRFAELYARELFERKKYGRNRIKSELFRRGIDQTTVNSVLDEIFESEETEIVQRIVDIIGKKYYNNMNNEKGRRRVFGSLVRMGYGFSDIREAMRAYCDDEFFEDY